MTDQLDREASPHRGRRRHRLVGALALLAGLATATALALSAPETPRPSVAPAPGAAPVKPTEACGGRPGCTVVAQVDVDGDRRPDEVGIVPRDLGGVDAPGTVTVRVRTATGRLLSATSQDVWWYGQPSRVWAGATAIDDVRGAELVLGQTMGAHTLQYRVLTYRDGQLATLHAPRPPKKTGQSRNTRTWTVDGSYGFQVGIDRSASRGRVTLTVTSAERNDSGHGHQGWAVSYRRTGSAWKMISAQPRTWQTDRAAATVGGWHLPGLPRFE